MMKKVLLAVIAILGIAAYLTVKEEGTDEAFGGLFAPVEPIRSADGDGAREPLAGMVTGQSIGTTSGTDYKQLVDRVRDRTNTAMKKSVARASR